MKKSRTAKDIKAKYSSYEELSTVGEGSPPRSIKQDDSPIHEITLQDKLIAKGEIDKPEPITEAVNHIKPEEELQESSKKQYARRQGRRLVQKTIELRKEDVLLLLNHFEHDLAGQSWSAGMRIVINYYIKNHNLR